MYGGGRVPSVFSKTPTDTEKSEIDAANSSGKQPVVFVHGLWLLSSSWDRWRQLFEAAGYATIAPGWPDDPETVADARENPEVFAHKMVQGVTDHYLEAIAALTTKPAVVGHSFGGLIAQKIAGESASAVTVAVDPAPFRGVLPLPISSLKSAFPVLLNPANSGKAVSLTLEEFKYGWANALSDEEAAQLHEDYHVAAPGAPLFEAASANLNPFSHVKVKTKKAVDRGPMLLISGEKDHTVPWAITNSSYKRQQRNEAVTEITEIADRGHSLTIDHGWQEVAQTALDFVARFAPATPSA